MLFISTDFWARRSTSLANGKSNRLDLRLFPIPSGEAHLIDFLKHCNRRPPTFLAALNASFPVQVEILFPDLFPIFFRTARTKVKRIENGLKMVPELVGVEFSRETHPSLEEMFFPAEYPWELRDHVTSSFDLDLFRGWMHVNGQKKPGRETEKGLLRG